MCQPAGDMDQKQIVQGKIAVRANADVSLSENKTTKKTKIELYDQLYLKNECF